MNYTEKEKTIIKQCMEGPFHTLVTELSIDEYDDLVEKLIADDRVDIMPCLVSIYWDYNRNKMIEYFIEKGDVDLLLGFLDYCNDFHTDNNAIDQKFVVDKLLSKNDKEFIKEILESNYLYFLIDKKERLIEYVSTSK